MPVYIPTVEVRSVMTEEQVREILARADKNKDGCLTMDEQKKALEEIGSRWPRFRAYLFLQSADFNGDGKISGKAEMDKLVDLILDWYHRKQGEVWSVMTEEQVREILARADKNKDGCLTMDELKKALEEIGSRWPRFRAYLFLQSADFNGDGKISGKAEMDKLVACILNWYYQK